MSKSSQSQYNPGPPATGRASQTRDARGNVVSMIDPVMLHVRRRYEVIDADTLDAINDDLVPGSAKSLRQAYLWVPGLLLLIATPITLVCLIGGISVRAAMVKVFVTNPGTWVPIIVAVIIPFFSARAARFKKLRNVMLRNRCCPHCGYSLLNLPVSDADHFTICPECACAWDLPTADRSSANAAGSNATSATRATPNRGVILLAAFGAMLLAAFVAFFLYRSAGAPTPGAAPGGSTIALRPILFIGVGILAIIITIAFLVVRRRG